MGRVIAGSNHGKLCDGFSIYAGLFKRIELSARTVAAVQWIDRAQFIALVRFRDGTESMIELARKEWPDFLGRMYGVPEYKRGEKMPRIFRSGRDFRSKAIKKGAASAAPLRRFLSFFLCHSLSFFVILCRVSMDKAK